MCRRVQPSSIRSPIRSRFPEFAAGVFQVVTMPRSSRGESFMSRHSFGLVGAVWSAWVVAGCGGGVVADATGGAGGQPAGGAGGSSVNPPMSGGVSGVGFTTTEVGGYKLGPALTGD